MSIIIKQLTAIKDETHTSPEIGKYGYKVKCPSGAKIIAAYFPHIDDGISKDTLYVTLEVPNKPFPIEVEHHLLIAVYTDNLTIPKRSRFIGVNRIMHGEKGIGDMHGESVQAYVFEVGYVDSTKSGIPQPVKLYLWMGEDAVYDYNVPFDGVNNEGEAKYESDGLQTVEFDSIEEARAFLDGIHFGAGWSEMSYELHKVGVNNDIPCAATQLGSENRIKL